MAPYLKRRFKLSRMKVAVIHDVLLEYGGAERVLEEVLQIFPKADLFTFYYNSKNNEIVDCFGKYTPKSSLLTLIPNIDKLGKYFSVTKIVSWLYFLMLNLDEYDLVISSSHSYNSKVVRVKFGKHVCYLHTTPKYLYREKSELGWMKKFPLNILVSPLIFLLRLIDYLSSKNPAVIISNSETVRKRVANYYGRSSELIYPPVLIKKSRKLQKNVKKYYLIISRLVEQKGIDLIIKTSNIYGFSLVVVGTGHREKELKSIAGQHVRFMGRVSDREIPSVYAGAKALLYTAVDEDFGLIPIEAMSFGVPVVAFRSGGVSETVLDHKTGILFDDYSISGLKKAIDELSNLTIKKADCLKQASKFRQSIFRRRLLEITEKVINGETFR